MKTLKRIPHKGIVAGVLAGFAEYFTVDVTALRVLFIFFVLFTGFFPGVIGYFLAMLIMPVDLPAQAGEPASHEHKEDPAPSQQ